MSRSIKGFFVNSHLMTKVEKAWEANDRKPIQTWSRRSTITPEFGVEFQRPQREDFVPVHVTENMVGHKLGEFSQSRMFKAHGGSK